MRRDRYSVPGPLLFVLVLLATVGAVFLGWLAWLEAAGP